MLHKNLFFSLALLWLSACGMMPQHTQTSTTGLLETRESADRAYWNNNWPTAESLYRELAEDVADDAEIWFRLGNIYAHTGRYDMAVTAYESSLKIDDSNSKTWHNLGLVRLRQASDNFRALVEHTPADDPLNRRARDMLDTLTRIMASRFGVDPDE